MIGDDLQCKVQQGYSDGVQRQCLRITGHSGRHQFVKHRANSHARRTRTADGKPHHPLAMVSGVRVEPRHGSRPGRYRGRRWGVIARLDGRDAAYIHWDGGDEQLCLLSDLRTEAECTFADGVYRCYNSIGSDVWGERVPPLCQFIDIMLDQMCYGPCGHSGLDAAEQAAWDGLSRAARVRIIRSVGP